MKVSKLKPVIHSFTFNDGSKVIWYPLDEKGRSSGYFTVEVHKKTGDDDIKLWKDRMGPPTAKASLNILKWAYKDGEIK